MLSIATSARWVRPTIVIESTSIKSDTSANGLGVKTLAPLARGSFIGAYKGSRWWRISEDAKPYRGKDSYVMQVIRQHDCVREILMRCFVSYA